MATCLRFSFSVRHLTLGAALLTFGALAAGETQAQSLDDTGVLGINSVQINKDVVVNADVVGNGCDPQK